VRLPAPPVLLITDRTQARHPLDDIAAAAFAAGCRWLLIRDKDMAPPGRRRLLDRALALGAPYGAVVTVAVDAAGDVAWARAAGAAGVHLPAGGDVAAARAVLGTGALIGISTHDAAELAAAARAGVDYATLGPVFATRSKPGYGPALGLEGLASLVAGLAADGAGPPIIALAGIEAEAAPGCLAAGAAGVAVMGAVMRAADPGAVVNGLIRALESGAP